MSLKSKRMKSKSLKSNKSKSKRMKSKSLKSKSLKSNKSKSKSLKSKDLVWGKIGYIYSPLKKKYIRLGTNNSCNVIKNELKRDNEWIKRVKYMSTKDNKFGNKLKKIL
jgi:hypothetical protein